MESLRRAGVSSIIPATERTEEDSKKRETRRNGFSKGCVPSIHLTVERGEHDHGEESSQEGRKEESREEDSEEESRQEESREEESGQEVTPEREAGVRPGSR
jgi:hypothetical protein